MQHGGHLGSDFEYFVKRPEVFVISRDYSGPCWTLLGQTGLTSLSVYQSLGCI